MNQPLAIEMTTCKICGENTLIPDDLEDTGYCNICAQEDALRMEWLDKQRGFIRGTSYPLWKVDSDQEDHNGGEPPDATIRQAIDARMAKEKPVA